jgi:hypothetical protein
MHRLVQPRRPRARALGQVLRPVPHARWLGAHPRQLRASPRRRLAPAGPGSRTAERADAEQACWPGTRWLSSRLRPMRGPGGLPRCAASPSGMRPSGPGDRRAAALHDHAHRRCAPLRRCRRWARTQRPLEGVRVLDLTRILAGPVGGRALAAYGADVMLVNAPHLPNIEAIADTSRGKRSALCRPARAEGRRRMDALLRDAHVFVQGYRPGGLQRPGLRPGRLAKRPGIVCVSLSAYGTQGPWRSGAASIRWCRRPPASTWPRAKPPAMPASRGLAHADPRRGHRLPDRLRRCRRAVAPAARGRQLARAGVAGADRALAAQPGPRRRPSGFARWAETSASGFGTGAVPPQRGNSRARRPRRPSIRHPCALHADASASLNSVAFQTGA